MRQFTIMYPDTVTRIETDSNGVFKYMFLAYGACIVGFKHIRKVIAIDGTHLRGKYRGVLLVATAQDGNYHIYPLAWAVVDQEDEQSWTWFLKNIEQFIPDSDDLVIISDRQKGLINGVENAYPKAHHGFCSYHLSKNLSQVVRRKKAKSLFLATAEQYTKADFARFYDDLDKRCPGSAQYLERSSTPEMWSRAYFPGSRYNIMTTNIAESINARLKPARKLPLTAMLDEIQSMLTEWFNDRRLTASQSSDTLTPKCREIIHDNSGRSGTLVVRSIKEMEYSVTDGDEVVVVDFSKKTCDCKKFQIDCLPCKHAIAAMSYTEFVVEDLSSIYYANDEWFNAYKCAIYPIPKARDWIIPEENNLISVVPPLMKAKRGRPKDSRFLSAGEFPKRRRKCSQCGVLGHNKKTCDSEMK